MKKLLLLICILSLIASKTIFAQQSQDYSTLTQMLHSFMEGASNYDRDIHENFWADELIYTSSTGTRFGKAQIMAGFDNKTEVSLTPKTIYTAENILIQQYGEMAVVAFKMKSVTGSETQYYLNSGTFLKRNGTWRVVNWHATKTGD
jgi:hypothetical protein